PIDDSEGFTRKISVNSSGDGKRDHQRRAHEKVCLHALMNARFEVSVPREDTGADDIVFRERFFNLWIQWSRISDACRASKSDKIEAQAIEEWLQPCLAKVLTHDARSRREGRLYPRLDGESAIDRLLRQQTSCQHHRRVGCI